MYVCTYVCVFSVYIPDGRYDYMTVSGLEHVRRLTKTGSERETLSHVQVAFTSEQS